MVGAGSRTRGKQNAVAATADQAATPAPGAAGVESAKAGERPARKLPPVDEAVDRQQRLLADALAQAEAIKYDQPPAKAGKVKWTRRRVALPESENARLGELKKRLGGVYGKSALLRAGVAVLSLLGDAELEAALARIAPIRGRRRSKK